MPIQTAYWLTRSKNRVDHLLRKNSGKQSSDRAARAMHPESIQRVIIPEESLHLRHHPIAHCPGKNADCQRDRKSTRLNSSHGYISYAVFCLKKNQSLPLSTRCWNVLYSW